MKKRLFTPLTILILILSTSACTLFQGTLKMSTKRPSTLTPFLPKATFTYTLTQVNDENLGQSADSTAKSGTTNEESSTKTVNPGSQNSTDPQSSPPPTVTSNPTTQLSPSFTPTPKSSSPPPTATKTPIPNTKAPSNTPDIKPTQTTNPSPTSNNDPPTSTPASSPTLKPTATPKPSGCDYTFNSNYENRVIELVNDVRKDHGLKPLSYNTSLRNAARRHSRDMACNNFLSHTGSDGSSPGDRIISAGYNYSWYAENIAASSSSSFTPQQAVNLWMNSQGHKDNILSDKAKHVGVGFCYVGDDDPQDMDSFYTIDFAKP